MMQVIRSTNYLGKWSFFNNDNDNEMMIKMMMTD